MAISDRLTKLTTDITNAYTSIENKLPKILPEGYTQVEYIESTGTQYIDTGVKGNSEIKIDIIFKITNTRETQFFFGSRQSVSAQAFCFLSTSGINNPWAFRSDFNNSLGLYQTENIRNMTGYPLFHVIKDKNVTTIENNEYINNISYSNFTSNYNIYIFTVNTNNNTSNFSYMKLYSCKMWNSSGNLVRDFIPCYRNSDNVIGMYDLINDVFYTNQGTGTFLKGYDTAIGMDKNTNNLATAINSIEVIEQATAEGESISLTNTKAMPYSDYVVKGKSEQDGEPSPSNPSDIHSVADDVNLFDEDTGIVNGLTYTSNGGTTSLASAFIQETYINVNPNTSYTLSTTNDYSTQDPGEYRLVICEYNASKTFIQRNLGSADVHNKYSIQTTSNTYYVRICASKVTINELKLQKGTIATPYSPYNQGTVIIKQRGKNLWTSNLPIIFSDGSSIVQDNNNGGIDMTIASNTSLGYILYDLGLISDFAGKTLTFSISNEPNALYKWCAFVACNADGSNRQELKNFYENNQITYTIGNSYSQTHLAIRLYIFEGTPNTTYSINNVQVEEGTQATPYEPYQGNDYTIQTEPLRSLPNGVKDTIEADGIHRRVGRIVLDGSESWIEGGTQYTGLYSAYINVDNMKKQEGYSGDLLSNCFEEKEFTIQEEGITKSANPVVFALILIRLSNTKATNLSTFKSWLSNNPTEVLYELATEAIEPLTQNQATTMLDIIKTGSYEGTTNIYTDEDVKPTIGVGYYKKV